MDVKSHEDVSGDDVRRALPRGINAASRDVVRASQRHRLIEAMIEQAATKGYGTVTIAGIVGSAGVAKPTFYEHFTDKEQCFLSAYDEVAGGAIKAMVDALDREADIASRIAGGLNAFLEYVAKDDNRARILLIESLRAGPAASTHVSEWHGFFANAYMQSREELRKTQPQLPPISRTRALAIVGAVNEPITEVLRSANAAAVLELEDELATVIAALAFATP